MSARKEVIGRATLYLGDCREIAPTLERPAAVISDPPYGQGYKPAAGRRLAPNGGTFKPLNDWRPITGDAEPFDPEPWLSAAPMVLLWGAHKFSPRLPDGTWLVWDKRPNGVERDQGDGEAAWLNRPGPMRIFRHLWDGLAVQAGSTDEVANGRQHPTQKPIEVMRWSIQRAKVPTGGLILDPYAGSGSTIVAAVTMGHPAVGIEIEPRYFDTACRRIEEAQRQLTLFGEVA